MLVLCSDGLSSDCLLSVVGNRVKQANKAALVVTADHVYKEKNYHVNRCIDELERLGAVVTLFDLDQHPAQKLRDYDIVEFIGGNPFYLLQSIRDHGAEDVLRDLARNRVLISWSAAAFVFGPTLELVNMYSPEMNFFGLTDLQGLCLTEIEVLPHYKQFLSRFERFEERCRDYEMLRQVRVIRLNDGEGVLIANHHVDVCRI